MKNETTEPRIVYSTNGHTWSGTYTSHMMMSQHDGKVHHYGKCSPDGENWAACRVDGEHCENKFSSMSKVTVGPGSEIVSVQPEVTDFAHHHCRWCSRFGFRWDRCDDGECKHTFTYVGNLRHLMPILENTATTVRVSSNAKLPFILIRFDAQRRSFESHGTELRRATTILTADQYSSDGVNWSDTDANRAVMTRPRNNSNAVKHYGACSVDGEHWHPCQGSHVGVNCGSMYASSEFFDQGFPGVGGGGETVVRLSSPEGKRCSADGFEWTKCDVTNCSHRYTYFGKFWGNIGIASGSAIGDDIHTVRITDDSILPFRQIRTHQDRLKRKAQNEKAQHERETVSHLECSVDNVGWGRCDTPETCTSLYVRRVMMDGSIQPHTRPVTAAPSPTPAPPIDTRYVKCGCGKHHIDASGDLYAQHHAWARTHEEENRWVCAGTFYAPGHGISHPKTGFKPLTILPDDQTGDEFEKWGR